MTTSVDMRDILTSEFLAERYADFDTRSYTVEDVQRAFAYISNLLKQQPAFDIPEIRNYIEPVAKALRNHTSNKSEPIYSYTSDGAEYYNLVGIVILHEALMAYEARVQTSV